ncbi:hypothetical protein D3C79_984540 [compost metagenome]
MPTQAAGEGTQLIRRGIRFQPALRTGPVKQLRAGQVQVFAGVGQRQTPEWAWVVEKCQAPMVQVLPPVGREGFTPQAFASGPHGTFTAFQTQAQYAAVMACGTDWDRLLAPLG